MLEFAYIFLSLIMVTLITVGYHSALVKMYDDPSIRRKKLALLIIGLTAWLVYVSVLGQTGFLADFEAFPPRFFLFTILPAFIFTGVFNYRMRHSALYEAIPTSWPVFYQTFRVAIETIFVYSVAAGVLHENVTIEGYNMDMIFGYSAPVIGYLVFVKKKWPVKAALIWNYLGLFVISIIIFLFMSSIYMPEIYGATESLIPIDATIFPYNLVAGFLMPSAVFMHVFSIVQLSKKK